MVDALSSAGEPATPSKGDVTLCLYCGAIAIVDDNLALTPPTEEMLKELKESDEFRRQYVAFAWARQHVMLNSHLLGYEAEHE
jgi:hypothetical protein